MGFIEKALAKAKQAGIVEEEVDEQVRHQEQEQYVDGMWHWLRTQLDEGCDLYQHEGKDDILRHCLTGRAFEDVTALLDQLRAQNMVWTFPKERRNDYILQLNQVLGDTYVVTEYFQDHSQIERYQNGQLVEVLDGDGLEKAIRATIVAEGESYYIAEVTLVADPSVDEV